MEKIFAPLLTSIFRDQAGVCAFYPPFFRGQGYLIKSADKVAQLKKIYAMWLLLIPMDILIAVVTIYVIKTQPDYKDAQLLIYVMPVVLLGALFNFGYVTQKRVKALVANAPTIGHTPTVN